MKILVLFLNSMLMKMLKKVLLVNKCDLDNKREISKEKGETVSY